MARGALGRRWRALGFISKRAIHNYRCPQRRRSSRTRLHVKPLNLPLALSVRERTQRINELMRAFGSMLRAWAVPLALMPRFEDRT